MEKFVQKKKKGQMDCPRSGKAGWLFFLSAL